MKGNLQVPQRVPVLTEVVDLPEPPPEPPDEYPQFPAPPVDESAAPAPLGEWPAAREALPAPVASTAGAIDEAKLVQRVLGDLDRQLDLMFEHRLRETLAPLLTRMTDTLVREMRNELATNLREMVARAVANELTKLGPAHTK